MAAAAVRTFKADPAAGELPFAAVGFDDVERAFLAATLDDPRGWGAYGFRFRPVPLRALHGDDKKGKTGKRRGAHDIVIELVEPAEMEARFPYAHLRGLSVCDSSDAHHPRIALHAGNWRAPPAASGYGDNVWAYRAYVVNHEVGHALGLPHETCGPKSKGGPAPIMVQQSLGTGACAPNPWPFPSALAEPRRT